MNEPGRVLSTFLHIQILYIFNESNCAIPVSALESAAAPFDNAALLVKVVLVSAPNRTDQHLVRGLCVWILTACCFDEGGIEDGSQILFRSTIGRTSRQTSLGCLEIGTGTAAQIKAENCDGVRSLRPTLI